MFFFTILLFAVGGFFVEFLASIIHSFDVPGIVHVSYDSHDVCDHIMLC